MLLGSFAGTNTGVYTSAIHKSGLIVSRKNLQFTKQRDLEHLKEYRKAFHFSGLDTGCVQAIIKTEQVPEFFYFNIYMWSKPEKAFRVRVYEWIPELQDYRIAYKKTAPYDRAALPEIASTIATVFHLPYTNVLRVLAHGFRQVLYYHASYVQIYYNETKLSKEKDLFLAPFVVVPRYRFEDKYGRRIAQMAFDKLVDMYQKKELIFADLDGEKGLIIVRDGKEYKLLTKDEFISRFVGGDSDEAQLHSA